MVDVLKLQTERLLDPRLSQKQTNPGFSTNMGASSVNYRRQASNSSSGNTSNINFNPVINTTSVLDRCMFTEVKFVLTFTGTTTGGNLLKSGYDSVRSFGSITQNTQLSINTQSISQESKYINHWLARFEDMERMKNGLTLSPYMASPDYTQSYEIANGTNHFNSLGDFTSSSPNASGRGMHKVNVISNTPTSAVVELTVFDYIYLSPMVYDSNQLYQGIPHVSSLQLSYTLTNVQRIWAHSNAGGGTITNLQVAINQAWLNFTELTPPPQVQIPSTVLLPYHEIERKLTNCNITIQPGATSTDLFSSTYTLNTIPLKCIVLVKERESDISTLSQLLNTPDVYGSIQQISIQYANQPSIFINCSPEQLYLISSRNGYQGSLESWRGETQIYNDSTGSTQIGLSGSVFCFDFGRDISVTDPSLLPSVASNVDFTINKITVKNTANRAISYDVEVFFIYDSVYEISLGSSRPYRAMILPSEVMDYPIVENKSVDVHLHGGDFKGMLKKALTGLKDSPILRKGAAALADAFIPQPERDLLKKYTGVGVQGSGITGNALIKKRNLKDRM